MCLEWYQCGCLGNSGYLGSRLDIYPFLGCSLCMYVCMWLWSNQWATYSSVCPMTGMVDMHAPNLTSSITMATRYWANCNAISSYIWNNCALKNKFSLTKKFSDQPARKHVKKLIHSIICSGHLLHVRCFIFSSFRGPTLHRERGKGNFIAIWVQHRSGSQLAGRWICISQDIMCWRN